MAKGPVKRGRGRPPLSTEEKRLPSMGFRPSHHVRRELEESAKQSGRSLSAEIETRLEQSFFSERQQEEALRGIFGTPEQYTVWRVAASAATAVSRLSGKSWLSDYRTFREALKAILLTLMAFEPKPRGPKQAKFSGLASAQAIAQLRRYLSELERRPQEYPKTLADVADPEILDAVRSVAERTRD